VKPSTHSLRKTHASSTSQPLTWEKKGVIIAVSEVQHKENRHE